MNKGISTTHSGVEWHIDVNEEFEDGGTATVAHTGRLKMIRFVWNMCMSTIISRVLMRVAVN